MPYLHLLRRASSCAGSQLAEGKPTCFGFSLSLSARLTHTPCHREGEDRGDYGVRRDWYSWVSSSPGPFHLVIILTSPPLSFKHSLLSSSQLSNPSGRGRAASEGSDLTKNTNRGGEPGLPVCVVQRAHTLSPTLSYTHVLPLAQGDCRATDSRYTACPAFHRVSVPCRFPAPHEGMVQLFSFLPNLTVGHTGSPRINQQLENLLYPQRCLVTKSVSDYSQPAQISVNPQSAKATSRGWIVDSHRGKDSQLLMLMSLDEHLQRSSPHSKQYK